MEALLLSGGTDSIAIAYWKRPKIAITVDYGQRPARAEVQAAAAVCAALNIEHDVVRVDCSSVGSGDLLGTSPLEIAPVSEWWPYRNQLLVTLAAARLAGKGFNVLLLGTVASDSVHADGTERFVSALGSCLLGVLGAEIIATSGHQRRLRPAGMLMVGVVS